MGELGFHLLVPMVTFAEIASFADVVAFAMLSSAMWLEHQVRQ